MIEGEIISGVTVEPKEMPEELVEAQRIQIDSDYADKVRHIRKLQEIVKASDKDSQSAMAEMMDTDILLDVLKLRFKALEEVITSVKEIFDRGKL